MAGTWSNVAINKYLISADFAFDSSHAAPAALEFPFFKDQGNSGSYLISDIEIIKGTTPYNTLTVSAARKTGVAPISFTLTDTGSGITAGSITSPVQYDQSVTVTLSGNTTNSAGGTMKIYLLPS